MPTTWFNDGVELGGGQSFTVGNEGDECNWRHIECALGLLLFRSVLTPPSPSGTDQFAYAACIGDRPAVLTTNIHYFQNLVRHCHRCVFEKLKPIALPSSALARWKLTLTIRSLMRWAARVNILSKHRPCVTLVAAIQATDDQLVLNRCLEYFRGLTYYQRVAHKPQRGCGGMCWPSTGSEVQISADGARWVSLYVTCDKADVSYITCNPRHGH